MSGMMSNSPRRIFNDWEANGLPAGANTIGKILSGSTTQLFGRVAPLTALVAGTITLSTGAYAAGDHCGSGKGPFGTIRFKNAARVNNGGGVIRGMSLVDTSNVRPQLDLIIFSTLTASEHGKDNAAYRLMPVADAWKVAGMISSGTKGANLNPSANWITCGTGAVQYVPTYIPFVCATGRDIYAEAVAAGTYDAVLSTDLRIRLHIEQN